MKPQNELYAKMIGEEFGRKNQGFMFMWVNEVNEERKRMSFMMPFSEFLELFSLHIKHNLLYFHEVIYHDKPSKIYLDVEKGVSKQ